MKNNRLMLEVTFSYEINGMSGISNLIKCNFANSNCIGAVRRAQCSQPRGFMKKQWKRETAAEQGGSAEKRVLSIVAELIFFVLLYSSLLVPACFTMLNANIWYEVHIKCRKFLK